MTSRDPVPEFMCKRGGVPLELPSFPTLKPYPESYESNVNNAHDTDQGEMLKGRVPAHGHAH